MGIELVGCRPNWTSPLCEMGISKRPIYQMTPTREQEPGEGNCARATARGIESCTWLGNVMSKSDTVRMLPPTRMLSHQFCEVTNGSILQGWIGKASEPIITNAPKMAALHIEFRWKQEGPNNEDPSSGMSQPPHARRPELTGLRTYEDHRFNRTNG